MHRSPGFTLLEVLIALVVVGALGVVGLQTLAQGSQVRARAAAYAEARPLLEQKLAELSLLSASELRALSRRDPDSLPAEEAGIWWVKVDEGDPAGLLFRVSVEVTLRGATLRSVTYLNRFGEPWREQTAGGTGDSP